MKDPDEQPDDALSCLVIGFMRHLAIRSVKKWRERHGDD
jgi:hypothetical protein